MPRRLLPILLVVTLSACAGVTADLGTERVTADYAAGGGQYDDGATVIFLTRAFERDGRVAFCGVRTAHSMTGRTLYLNDFVADVAVMQLASDRIVQGLEGLPEAPYQPDMTGAVAGCHQTDRPWRPGYAGETPTIRIARLQFDHDGDGGFGDTVVFRQTPVDRPLP